MAKQDLYERSPVRIFNELTDGGLKAGELGLVAAKKGLGKTSVLVQFGMDALLNGKQLVHVSFNQHSGNVISWYDGIYNEISKKKALGDSPDLKEQVVRNRTILNFNQDNISLEKVVNTLNSLKASGTNVAAVVIDDVDFAKVGEADLQTVSSYAKATKTKVWFSSTVQGDTLESCAPADLLSYFYAVVHLTSRGNATQLDVLKMGQAGAVETSLKLDSKTLLITK